MDPITLMLLLSGGASLIGSIANGIGSAGAAGAQRDAANQALDLQRDIWGQQQRNQAPYLQAGRTSLADLLQQMHAGAFDVDPASLANDPGYQFRLQQGQQALERSAAARGLLGSGGTLRSLTRYSQGVASDELQNAYNRRQGNFNRLATVAGMGQGAANNLGAMGGQYANNASELYGAIGNANAAGQMGIANAISGGAGQIGGTLGSIAGFGGMGATPIPTQWNSPPMAIPTQSNARPRALSAVGGGQYAPNTLASFTYGGK